MAKPSKNHSTNALPSIKCKAYNCSYQPVNFRREVHRESIPVRAGILELYNAGESAILRKCVRGGAGVEDEDAARHLLIGKNSNDLCLSGVLWSYLSPTYLM